MKKYPSSYKPISVKGKTLDQIGIEAMKTTEETIRTRVLNYRATLDIQMKDVEDINGSQGKLYINLPLGEELNLSEARKQLEKNYSDRQITRIFDAMLDAACEEMVAIEVARMVKIDN